jgi:hypothetical protein
LDTPATDQIPREAKVPEHLRMSQRGTVHVVAAHERAVAVNRRERRAEAARRRREKSKAARAAEAVAAFEAARAGDAEAAPEVPLAPEVPPPGGPDPFEAAAAALRAIGFRFALLEGRVDRLLAALGDDPERIAWHLRAAGTFIKTRTEQNDALAERVGAIESRLRGLAEGLGA